MALPLPCQDALAHQQRLLTSLKKSCETANGWLPFATFMEKVLYEPGLGYYSAGMVKLGEQGDFITAPEISPLFSQCLGFQCADILAKLPSSSLILELGAGSGKMAAQILKTLQEKNQLPAHYFILEVSADLKARQQHYLAQEVPFYFEKIQWLDALPTAPFTGIILGNEVIDALPIHLFKINEKAQICEGGVCFENNQWQLTFQPAPFELQKAVQALQNTLSASLPYPYVSEINLQLTPWLKSLAAYLTQGVVLFIDYGFPKKEYYHPTRQTGTLMCHYRHFAHPDPLKYIGLQDITAHVDFTALAQAAKAASLDMAGFTTQAHFLIANGILTLAEQQFSSSLALHLSQQLQLLLQPHEMGELFKAIAFSKDFSYPLQGFSHKDERNRI